MKQKLRYCTVLRCCTGTSTLGTGRIFIFTYYYVRYVVSFFTILEIEMGERYPKVYHVYQYTKISCYSMHMLQHYKIPWMYEEDHIYQRLTILSSHYQLLFSRRYQPRIQLYLQLQSIKCNIFWSSSLDHLHLDHWSLFLKSAQFDETQLLG